MRSELEQSFPYIGQLAYSKKTHAGTLIFESFQTHDHLVLNSGKTFFPYGAGKTVDTYELDGMHVATVATTSVYDSHGNNTHTSTTTSDVTGTYTNVVDNTYADDVGNWILGKLQSATTAASAPGTPSITRRTDYQSDSLGRVTQQVVEPLHSQAVTTSFQYDGFGNKVQTTVSAAGIASRTSSVSYSADGRFPLVLTNAIGHSATQEFDGRFGNLTRKTDANGQIQETLYNAFGVKTRDIQVRQVDPNNEGDGEESVLFSWCDASSNCPDHAVYYVTAADNQGESPEAAYFDVFAREIRTTSFGFNGEAIYKATEYDAFGHKHRVSELHFDGDPPNWTTTSYDVLGRPVQVTHPNGAVTTIEHQGRTTRIENALNQVTTKTDNALGKPVQTVDAHGSVTQLSYDAAGNLAQTQDPHGNIITNTYDVFGRKTSMDDPDMGYWEYQYDPLGNLVYQKDAKGQEVTMTYDLLNRRISRSEPEGLTTWTYDSAANGKGRLAQVSQADGYTRDHAYDELGRPSSQHDTIDGQVHTTNWYYQGTTDRVDYTEYPSGLVVRRTYNNYGFPDGVRVSGLETIQEYQQVETEAQQLADDHNALVTDLAPQHDAEVEQANVLIAQAEGVESEARRLQEKANSAVARYKRDVALANQYAAEANSNYRKANNHGHEAMKHKAWFTQFEDACTGFDPEDVSRAEWCEYAADNIAPQKENLLDYHIEQANRYKSRGDSAAGKANSYSRSANSHAQAANSHAAQAQSKMSQANDLYAQAQIHINAAEALKAQIDESYRQWDEANKEAGRLYDLYVAEGSILVWSAHGTDAEGRVTAYTQGNGVTTNVEYYAQSGHIKRVSADVTDQEPFSSEKIQDYRDWLIAGINATIDAFSGDVITYQTERNNAQALIQAATDNADAAQQTLDIYNQTGDSARALFAKSEHQRYLVEAEVQTLNRDLNDNLVQIHNGTISAAQGLIAGYGTVALDMNQNHALEAEYHNLMAAHYHLVESLYQSLSTGGQTLVTQYENVYLEPTQEDLDGFDALALEHEDLSILNELRASTATGGPDGVSRLEAWSMNQEIYQLYGNVLGNMSGVLDDTYRPGRELNILLGEYYTQQGSTGVGGFYTGRQDLGQPRIDFYGDLSALYQQRSSQTQAIVDQLDASGGGYAPVIDHSLVAELNLALSEQFTVMSTAQYWDDFSQNLGADFGELSALYDTVAGQNANLAQGHEQQALAAHNAYDHGLLVFDGVIQDQTFIYDPLGNLTERIDAAVDMLETFEYDQLNRITGHGRSGQGAGFYELADLASIGYQYDALGNITHRTDVGSYSYGAQAGPHAVTAVSGSEAYHKNTSYTYDANGNQTGGDGRSLQWASFNKPTTISRAGTTVTMAYGPERQLYRQVENDGSSTRTTTYVGGIYEKETQGAQTTHRYHIAVGGEVMAVLVDQSEELPEAHYFHRDHQNSIVAVSDKNGYVIERYTYDAFGQRHRAVAANDPFGNLLNAVTDRGYTGHIHMAGIGLINMNGRLFDATIGRFISADPFIQAPLLSQSYNRYSYVLNNPLKLVDPSGYLFGWAKKLVKKVKKIVAKVVNIVRDVVKKVASFVKTYWRPIAAVAVSVVAYKFGQAWIAKMAQDWAWATSTTTGFAAGVGSATVTTTSLSTAGAVAVGAGAGAIAGGTSGLVMTGSLRGMVYGASAGALFGAANAYFGSTWNTKLVRLTALRSNGQIVGNFRQLTALGNVGKVASYGVANGISNIISGRRFTDGLSLTLGISGLSQISRWMRDQMILDSAQNPYNLAGASAGMDGDSYKIGGGRVDPWAGGDGACAASSAYDGICNYVRSQSESPLGGHQGQKGRLHLGVYSVSYESGGFADALVEHYAGPHDWLNSHYFYDPFGNLRGLSTARGILGVGVNALNVVPATPFASAHFISNNMGAFSLYSPMSNQCLHTMGPLIVILASSVVLSCQVNTKAGREHFVRNFDNSIGYYSNTEGMIQAYREGYWKHIKLVDVVTKQDGSTHVIIDWGPEGCRVGEVYRDNVFVDWYFVKNQDKCYAITNWGGPW